MDLLGVSAVYSLLCSLECAKFRGWQLVLLRFSNQMYFQWSCRKVRRKVLFLLTLIFLNIFPSLPDYSIKYDSNSSHIACVTYFSLIYLWFSYWLLFRWLLFSFLLVFFFLAFLIINKECFCRLYISLPFPLQIAIFSILFQKWIVA